MSNGTKRCAFCGEVGPTTREHVWPAWLRKILRDQKLVARHRRTSTIPGLDATWESPPFTMTVKGICGTCNNGWMSELEAAAKPILTPLILGQPLEPKEPAQRVIATWTVKTAMVYQLTSAHTAIRPHQFNAVRLHRRPPAGVQVWTGHRTADEPTPSVFGYRSSALVPASADVPAFHAFLVTLAIGHWIGQCYGTDIPFASEWQRGGEPGERLDQIWPAVQPRVRSAQSSFTSFVPLAEDPGFEAELKRVMACQGVDLRLAPTV